MNCIYCGHKTSVIDVRPAPDEPFGVNEKGNPVIRRRRECQHCENRVTTYEIVYGNSRGERLEEMRRLQAWLDR